MPFARRAFWRFRCVSTSATTSTVAFPTRGRGWLAVAVLSACLLAFSAGLRGCNNLDPLPPPCGEGQGWGYGPRREPFPIAHTHTHTHTDPLPRLSKSRFLHYLLPLACKGWPGRREHLVRLVNMAQPAPRFGSFQCNSAFLRRKVRTGRSAPFGPRVHSRTRPYVFLSCRTGIPPVPRREGRPFSASSLACRCDG